MLHRMVFRSLRRSCRGKKRTHKHRTTIVTTTKNGESVMSNTRWLSAVLRMDRDSLIHELTRTQRPAQRRILEKLINGHKEI